MNCIPLQITESIVRFLERICPKTGSGPSGFRYKKPPELSTRYITKGSRTRSGPPSQILQDMVRKTPELSTQCKVDCPRTLSGPPGYNKLISPRIVDTLNIRRLDNNSFIWIEGLRRSFLQVTRLIPRSCFLYEDEC